MIEFFWKTSDAAIGFFNNAVNMLSHGDAGMRSVVSIFLLGMFGWFSRKAFVTYPTKIRNFLMRRLTVMLEIIGDDSASGKNYFNFIDWFEKADMVRGTRVFRLTTKAGKTLVTPGTGFHWFIFDARLYWMYVINLESSGSDSEKTKVVLRTFGFSDSVFEHLTDQFRMVPKTELGIYVSEERFARIPYNRVKDMPPMAIDRVIMREDQLKRLTDQIDWFLSNKDWYLDNHLDYKLVILLYGPPGTGKSYLCKALANYMKKNLILVNPCETMANFRAVFSRPMENSMFVIEDFDDNELLHRREEEQPDGVKKEERKTRNNSGGVDLSTFLNILQGVATNSGQIVFLSTNHLEKLDPAVYRPDRVDMIEEILPLGHREIHRYMDRVYKTNSSAFGTHRFHALGASYLSFQLKKNPNTPHDFYNAIVAEDKRLALEKPKLEAVA